MACGLIVASPLAASAARPAATTAGTIVKDIPTINLVGCCSGKGSFELSQHNPTPQPAKPAKKEAIGAKQRIVQALILCFAITEIVHAHENAPPTEADGAGRYGV